jgi:Na+-transporting methylmalonyl-CoA/oxaloacetate decarboxylase gamma subunit
MEGPQMDTWTFGWTLALIGMAGTMFVLWILSLLILLIRKIFPQQSEATATKKG